MSKKSSWKLSTFSKEEKEKSDNTVMNDIKIYQKMKNKSLLSIEKIIRKWENHLVVIIRNICFKNSNLESSFDEECKDVLKNQFWSYKFTSESQFKRKFTLNSWFKWKKVENYKSKQL